MASLEKRGNKYRIVLRLAGEKFARSLKTKSEKDALGSLARLEDNLRRVELGTLPLPESADVATFLLSDGKAEAKPRLSPIRTLSQLFDSYLASFPAGSIEEITVRTMRIHITGAHNGSYSGRAAVTLTRSVSEGLGPLAHAC